MLWGRQKKLEKRKSDSEALAGGENRQARLKYLRKSKRFVFFKALSLFVSGCGVVAALAFILHGTVSRQFERSKLLASGLPTDIDTKQLQLDSIAIGGRGVSDFEWLASRRLTEMKIEGDGLKSLKGITNAPNLKILGLDLRNSPIDDLAVLSRLENLQDLTLFLDNSAVRSLKSIAGIKRLNALTVDMGILDLDLTTLGDKALRSLTLQLEGSDGKNLDGLNNLKKVASLSLDLKSSSVPELPDLKELKQLTKLQLQLASSRIEELDSIGSLSGLSALSVNIQGNDRVRNLPDLSQLENLQCLYLNLADTTVPTLPSGMDKGRLQFLTLDLTESSVETLQELGHLNSLQNLTLELDSSAVAGLPALPPRHGLEMLIMRDIPATFNLEKLKHLAFIHTLEMDLRSVKIQTMPDLSHIPELRALTLHLDWGQLESLGPLPKVNELTVYLDGKEQEVASDFWKNNAVAALARIVQLRGLKHLTLHLEASKIQRLPDFGEFNRLEDIELDLKFSEISDLSSLAGLNYLSRLKLDLEATPNLKQLPDWRMLRNLQQLEMILTNSGLRDLSSLGHTRQFHTLKLDLQDAEVQSLPDTNDPANAQEVILDLQNFPMNDLHRISGFPGVREITVNRNIQSLEGLPERVIRLNLGVVPPSALDSQDSCRDWPVTEAGKDENRRSRN